MDRRRHHLNDVEARSITIGRQDKPAIVHLDIVGHVAVGIGVGIGFRYVKRHFDRGLRLADVPNPYAPREVRGRRQLAVQRIIEVSSLECTPKRAPRVQ